MRWFFAVFLACYEIFAAEIIASKIISENNTTKASGDVVLLNDKVFIRSDNLILCNDTNETELFGNVYIAQPNGDISLTDYLYLYGNKSGASDGIFTHFVQTGLWLTANEATMDGNITRVKKGAISGCIPTSPDWSIRFSSAKVDQEKEWLDLYNPVFYAGRVPVFYLPYFGNYTTNKRRSGLLIPSIGQSNKEGFLYGQPIYFAPHDQFDFEFTPQIRTDRGSGITGKFRFVDSPYSKGSVVYGEFRDSSSYENENGVAVPKHWGKRLEYKRSKLFTSKNSSSQEGLLVKYEDYSDVEFVDLETIDSAIKDRDLSALITNKLDYFYKNSAVYAGVYTRDFKNIENKERDSTTVQITPELHGHLFSRSFLTKDLIVSLDARAKNYTRDEGLQAQDRTIIAPASYNFSLFDDYLQLKATYQASYYQIDYDDSRFKTGTEMSQKAGATIGTLLAKPYESFFHTVGASVSYLDPFSKKVEGDFVEDFVSKSDDESAEHPTTSLKFMQYFYNNEGLNFLSHRVNQAMINDENSTLLDLENEVIIRPTKEISLTNTTKYSHDYDAVVSTKTSLAKSGDFSFAISHIYENKEGKEVTKRYITTKAGYKIDGRHRVDGEWQRDLLAKEDRGWQVAYSYNKKCWKSELSFNRRISPYTTASGDTSSRINDVVFLKLTLVPFGDLNQQLYEKERG